MRATIDQQGRVAFDAGILQMLGVQPGDELTIERQGDRWIIIPIQSKGGLKSKDNVLVHDGLSPSLDALTYSRESRMDELSGRHPL